MALENMMDVSTDVETGFLACKTIDILKTSHSLEGSDELIIRESIELVRIIREGRDQVNTGKLSESSIAAAHAYNLSSTALLQYGQDNSKEFEKYISKIQHQLEDVVEKMRVPRTKVKEARGFFEILLKYSINKSGSSFYDKVEENEWLK